MATLIEKTSPLYRKRMVRAVRRDFRHGVYYFDGTTTHRVTRIALTGDALTVRALGNERFAIPVTNIDGFRDGYGRHICASRETQ